MGIVQNKGRHKQTNFTTVAKKKKDKKLFLSKECSITSMKIII